MLKIMEKKFARGYGLELLVRKDLKIAKKPLESVYHQGSGTLTSWKPHHEKINVHQYQREGLSLVTVL